VICVYCGHEAGAGSVHAANVCGACDCGAKILVNSETAEVLTEDIFVDGSKYTVAKFRKWEWYDVEFQRYRGKVPLLGTGKLVPPNQMCPRCKQWGQDYNEPGSSHATTCTQVVPKS